MTCPHLNQRVVNAGMDGSGGASWCQDCGALYDYDEGKWTLPNPWRPVGEPPESGEGTPVLAWTPSDYGNSRHRSHVLIVAWSGDLGFLTGATHWMPLPEGPQ